MHLATVILSVEASDFRMVVVHFCLATGILSVVSGIGCGICLGDGSSAFGYSDLVGCGICLGDGSSAFGYRDIVGCGICLQDGSTSSAFGYRGIVGCGISSVAFSIFGLCITVCQSRNLSHSFSAINILYIMSFV